jgi:hypothetical protein
MAIGGEKRDGRSEDGDKDTQEINERNKYFSRRLSWVPQKKLFV